MNVDVDILKDIVFGLRLTQERAIKELRDLLAKPACGTCHDQGEVFVSKGKVEYGMETEPDPIYKTCPDCGEPDL